MNSAEERVNWAELRKASLFSAYSCDLYRSWRGSHDVHDLLANDGGTYAITGPRGSGKTWFIQAAVDLAKGIAVPKATDIDLQGTQNDPENDREPQGSGKADDSEESIIKKRGFGLLAPVPSRYEAKSYVEALMHEFAQMVRKEADSGIRDNRAASRRKRLALSVGERDKDPFKKSPSSYGVAILAQNGFDFLIALIVLLALAGIVTFVWPFVASVPIQVQAAFRVILVLAAIGIGLVVIAKMRMEGGSSKKEDPPQRFPKKWLSKLTPSGSASYGIGSGLRNRIDNSGDSMGVVILGLLIALSVVPSIAAFLYQWNILIGRQAPYAATAIKTISILSAAVFFLLVIVLWTSYLFRDRGFSSPKKRYEELKELKKLANKKIEWVRFSTRKSSSSEIGAVISTLVSPIAKIGRQKELTERPYSLTSLIVEFTSLAGKAKDVLKGPIVIGVDELDKNDNPDEVRSLLRDIKGIFPSKGVHFLLSVSYEAANSLELGALHDRNEFHSSFSQVLELKALTPKQSSDMINNRIASVQQPENLPTTKTLPANLRELLNQTWRTISSEYRNRVAPVLNPPPSSDHSSDPFGDEGNSSPKQSRIAHLPDNVGRAIGILGEGLPREILRLMDVVLKGVSPDETSQNEGVRHAVAAVMRAEAAAFSRTALSSKKLSQSVKKQVYEFLQEDKFRPNNFYDRFNDISDNSWNLELDVLLPEPTHEWEVEANEEDVKAHRQAELRNGDGRGSDAFHKAQPPAYRVRQEVESLIQEQEREKRKQVENRSQRQGRESWQRLLLRLRVASIISEKPENLVNTNFCKLMSKVVVIGSRSPEIGRDLLDNGLRSMRQAETTCFGELVLPNCWAATPGSESTFA